MKKIALCATLMMLAFSAHATDDTPNARNITKVKWGAHVAGRNAAPGFFVLFMQKPCKHIYSGKLKGAEKFGLRRAAIHIEEDGAPGALIGNGCWDIDHDEHKVNYLGFEGVLNADRDGKVFNVPWDNMFNADNAG